MRIWFSVAAMSVMLTVASAAVAQSLVPSTDYEVPQFYGRDKNTSVLERERPEYQALGIRAGGFTVLPRLEAGLNNTNNVYFADSTTAPGALPKVSDTFFTLKPSVVVQSNWGRHALRLQGGVQAKRYSDYSSENTTGWNVRGDGKIDIYGDSFINVGGDAQKVFEDRGSVNGSQNNLKPVPVEIQGLYARGVYGQDRVRGTLDASYRNFDYKNVSGNIDQNGRDYDGWQVGARGDVALSPDTALFVKGNYGENTYKHATITNPARDNSNARILGGANFDLTSLARGELGVGYIKRDYDRPTFTDISGFALSSKLEYFPTQLLTVTGVAVRQIQDSSFNNSGGYFQNMASLGADYELRRNLIVSVAGSYEYDKYKGVDRKDKVGNLALSGRYFVNNTVGLGLTLSSAKRTSKGADFGPEYKARQIGLSLVFQR
jgi:hypothetical protein